MRVNINSNGLYSITSMDVETLNVVLFILDHAKDRCFKEYDIDTNHYYSGEGFSLALSPDELKKFHGFVHDFWMELDKMRAKMFNLKKQEL
jgi:hypothetical protein